MADTQVGQAMLDQIVQDGKRLARQSKAYTLSPETLVDRIELKRLKLFEHYESAKGVMWGACA